MLYQHISITLNTAGNFEEILKKELVVATQNSKSRKFVSELYSFSVRDFKVQLSTIDNLTTTFDTFFCKCL